MFARHFVANFRKRFERGASEKIIRRLELPRSTIDRAGKKVIIWRVDVIFLTKDDWKYEKSTAKTAGGGRTHTFGVKQAASKLSGCAVYRRKDVVIKDGKPIAKNDHDIR